MRLLASAALMFAAAVLVVVAFLHFPVVTFLPMKPMKPSERLPSLSDVGPDSPEPPPPAAKQVAKMQGVFGSMCRNSVRSESERRKLEFRGGRIAALCGCLVDNMIENRGGHDGREGFENFGLIVGKDTAPERRALDDARYLAMIADAERACAQRREAAAGNRPQAGPAGGTATGSRPQAGPPSGTVAGGGRKQGRQAGRTSPRKSAKRRERSPSTGARPKRAAPKPEPPLRKRCATAAAWTATMPRRSDCSERRPNRAALAGSSA